MRRDGGPPATAGEERFLADLVAGLEQPRKEIPSKYFYDAEGSALFERICDLPEYYLTRAELGIMEGAGGEMGARLGPRCLVVELGSGASVKTRLLLSALVDPAGYVPVDIASETLERSADALRAAYPGLEVLPLAADFTGHLVVPVPSRPPSRTVVYFPGSTIGNLQPAEMDVFLRRIASLVGPGGALLVGIDLVKDAGVIERAYNDAAGVTAAFNRNVLARANRELGADFALEGFAHRAAYNARLGRIEMYLVSTVAQTAHVGDRAVRFAAGEPVLTELSYKYDAHRFREMAAGVGLRAEHAWTDARGWFSVEYLIAGG